MKPALISALAAIGLAVAACGDAEEPGPPPQTAAPASDPTPPRIDVPPAPERIARPRPAPPERPWNLVLVSVDTLRADHLSAYGYERETSPSLDRLAREGVLFEHAYSHSPKTTPSHMSLFTSLYPEVHRVLNRAGKAIDSSLSRGIPTAPELLRAAGYRSAAFTAGGNMHRRIGFGRGFDHYAHLRGPAEPTFSAGIEQLRRWQADRDASEPFFLFLHTVQTHDPYLPEGRDRRDFVEDDYAGPIVSDRARLEAMAAAENRSLAATFWARVDPDDPKELQHLVDLYDACIRTTDRQIGRLVEALDALGLKDETIVVVTSDHGEEFMEHGGTRHNSVFEELLHVPLVVRLPSGAGVAPGTRVEASVRLIDVLPTLLDLLGLERPAHLEGRSAVPLMLGAPGERDEPPRYVFAHWRERGVRSLRAGRFKLIRIPDDVQLFDLEQDPGEHRPALARHPAAAEHLARHLAELMRTARETAASVEPGAHLPMDAESREQLRALGYLE